MESHAERTIRWPARRSRFLVLALAGLMVRAVPAADPGAITIRPRGPAPLVVGIFPRRAPANTRRMFTPLVTLLARRLARPVTLATPPDFASFWENVRRDRYALVHYNPYHYLRAHRELGHQVIARNEEFGQAEIRAVIIVRRDSGITRVGQLRGRKVLFGGGRGAMVSYIAASDLLHRAGLRRGDYLEKFALNPPKACIAVYFRQAAACGAGHRLLQLEVVRQAIDPDALTILVSGEPLAHLPWAVSRRVDDTMRRRLQAILTGLGTTAAGRAALRQAGLSGLVTTTDADYDPHREVVARVLGERY